VFIYPLEGIKNKIQMSGDNGERKRVLVRSCKIKITLCHTLFSNKTKIKKAEFLNGDFINAVS